MLGWNSGFEKFCLEFGMLKLFGMAIAVLRMDFATEAALAFQLLFQCSIFFLAVAMGAGQSSSSRRRPGDEEIDRVLELIRLQKPGDPGIDTSCQCPIATFTTSKYTSSSTYSRCPSKFS